MVTTNCFIYEHPRLLLGMKKRGFGQGRWNGFGGKVAEGETIEQAAKRETEEECGVKVLDCKQLGELQFSFKDKNEVIDMHIFLITKYAGEPVETEEMKPEWFEVDKLPYPNMWPDDPLWMPLFLSEKNFKGKFLFEGYNKILKHELRELR